MNSDLFDECWEPIFPSFAPCPRHHDTEEITPALYSDSPRPRLLPDVLRELKEH